MEEEGEEWQRRKGRRKTRGRRRGSGAREAARGLVALPAAPSTLFNVITESLISSSLFLPILIPREEKNSFCITPHLLPRNVPRKNKLLQPKNKFDCLFTFFIPTFLLIEFYFSLTVTVKNSQENIFAGARSSSREEVRYKKF